MTLVTGTIVDMHIHTLNGASDSMLDPEHLVEEAANIGLTGVNISEHDRVWERHAMDGYRAAHPELFVSSGMEVSTDLGHVIVVGLREYVTGIRRCEELRRVVSDQGAYMVVAHPFRHHFDPVHFQRSGQRPFDLTPEQAVEMPVFKLVDDVEVADSRNTPRENCFALKVARILGKPGFGGSDAHSRTGIGSSAVMFQKQLTDMGDLLAELHGGRYCPMQGLPAGRPRPFSDIADEFELALAR